MRLALLGDIALFGRMSVNENQNLADYFKDVADYLAGFDYVVGNFETPFSVKKKTNGAKSAYICSDPDNIQILKLLHINAVNLANNHMFDFGNEGYEVTKKILDENGIDFFGTEGKELFWEKEGNRIAFSGVCCYTANPLCCVPYGEYGVNAYNLPKLQEIIQENHKKGYLNIVAIHAGLEHVNYPSLDHIKAARKIADTTPYVYYGHHPHVIQGVEDYKGALIAHSLGNFCFDDIFTKASGDKPLVTLTENNRQGLILELTIEDNKIVYWREQVIYNSKGDRMQLIENEDALTEYNEAVAHSLEQPQAYIKKRKLYLDIRANERKSLRNLKWYVKRLRPQYFKLILDGKKNEKLYKYNIKQYINEL